MNQNEKIIETIFNNGLKKEKKHIHRDMILAISMKNNNCSKENIVFSDYASREFDDVVSVVNCRKLALEYKMDFLANISGNIVFEIIPYIDISLLPKEWSLKKRIPLSDKEKRKQIDSLIEKIKAGDIDNAKISRHLLKENIEYKLCYAISKENEYNTKDTRNIARYLIFNGQELSDRIRNNYMKEEMIITQTLNNGFSWFTISILVKEKDLLTLCSVYDNIGNKIGDKNVR